MCEAGRYEGEGVAEGLGVGARCAAVSAQLGTVDCDADGELDGCGVDEGRQGWSVPEWMRYLGMTSRRCLRERVPLGHHESVSHRLVHQSWLHYPEGGGVQTVSI